MSEYSTSGAYALGDFVEIYNGTGVQVDVSNWELHIFGSGASPIESVSIPDTWGTNLLPGHHVLFGLSGTVVNLGANGTFTTPLGPTTGIGIWDGATYVDAVGNRQRTHPTTYPEAGISEGTGVPPMLPILLFDQSYERRLGVGLGNCVDTDDNSVDFFRNFAAGAVNPQSFADDPEPCATDTTPPPPPADHLVISEFRTDGSNGGQDEFTEIFNPTQSIIGLQDYAIYDQGMELEIELPVVDLNPGDHFVIKGTDYAGPWDAIYDNNGIQNHGAIILALRGPTPIVVDEVELNDGPGSPILPLLDGRLDQSLQRINGGCTDTDTAADFEWTLVSSPSTLGTNITPCV